MDMHAIDPILTPVKVTMEAYIADSLADLLQAEADNTEDQGWSEMAVMLREGGRSSDVRVERSVIEHTIDG